jgi:RNA polymerase sigma factor (sigma-70 family)
VERLLKLVSDVYNHPDFKPCLGDQAARAGTRRSAAQHVEDIEQEALAFVLAFLRTEPHEITERFWLRLRDRLDENPDFSLQVSPDRPLPQPVFNEIYNLCLNLTPRQTKCTPRSFYQGEDVKIVQQGLRGRSGGRHDQDPLATLIDEDEKRRVREALRVLDDRSRRIVELRTFEGYELQAIAEEFGVSQTRIRQIFTRALEKLSRRLAD